MAAYTNISIQTDETLSWHDNGANRGSGWIQMQLASGEYPSQVEATIYLRPQQAFDLGKWLIGEAHGMALDKGIELQTDAKTPEPHFCKRDECRGLPRCPRDPVCND